MKRLVPYLTVLTLLSAEPAYADGLELNEASKKVFGEAVDAVEKKDWAVCRTKAIGVWQQIKNPKVAGILGICEAELGMNRDAAEHLDYFFKNEKGTPEAQRAQAKQRMDKVRPKVAELTVMAKPSDAEVSINGTTVGRGTVTVFVDAGDVAVGCAKNGQSRNRTISVKAGATERVEIEVPVDPSGAGGAAAGGGDTGGAGAVDGAGAGGAGGAPPVTEPKPAWPAIVLGVAGGVFIVGSIGSLVGAIVTHGDAEDAASGKDCNVDPSVCTDVDSTLDTANALGVVSFVGLGLGAAALTGMAIYIALPDGDAKAEPGPAVSLRVRGTFLSLEGAF